MDHSVFLLNDREEVLPFADRVGVDTWREGKIPFKVHYDLVKHTASGLSMYRILYTLGGEPHSFVLVADTADGCIEAETLIGWGGVQVFHAAYGDKREIRFRANDRVQLI
jgi:hypothetical protein